MIASLKIAFYRCMLWWMRYGLAIAASTGRNPDAVAAKRRDISSIEGHVHRLQVRSLA